VYHICADRHEQDLPILYTGRLRDTQQHAVEKDSRAKMLYELRRAMVAHKVSSEKWCERYYELIEERTKHKSQY
jgi:hypothetical protein